MADRLEVEAVIPASAQEVFEAWLDGERHGAMTGSPAAIQSDGSFVVWDGYASGKTVEAVANERIVQTWRTADFPAGAPDSRLEVHLAPHSEGVVVKLVHAELPDGTAEEYRQGWMDFYFTPMRAHFGKASAAEPVEAKPARTSRPPARGGAKPQGRAPTKAAPKRTASRSSAAGAKKPARSAKAARPAAKASRTPAKRVAKSAAKSASKSAAKPAAKRKPAKAAKASSRTSAKAGRGARPAAKKSAGKKGSRAGKSARGKKR